MKISPLAGKPAPQALLINTNELIQAYYIRSPNPKEPAQRVQFGTSGHRGSSLDRSFNENHILAITQAICEYRLTAKIEGPLFLGMDTHALSKPALSTSLEVLAANGVRVLLSENDEYTPTPALSRAILTYNRGRDTDLADGIIITPSHNPPGDGGFKYNPPNGGPADQETTKWIENRANQLLESSLVGVKRVSSKNALSASTTERFNFLESYVEDLRDVIDMEAIANSKISIGVDPLGGAGVHYWQKIKERYNLNLTIINETIDPTFAFMTVDWDGQIRMDPSSSYAMQSLIKMKDQFDVSFACDTDYDRHGIVTKSKGLLTSNHFLSAAISYLFQHRPEWSKEAQIGKTVVSSSMIDRVAAKLKRAVYEVPVGFKWFVEGLFKGTLGIVGEESAGAAFLRHDGSVWTTDKDGIIMCLLAAEMRARTGQDPGQIYEGLTKELGAPFFDRVDQPATRAQKELLKKLTAEQLSLSTLAGEKVISIITHAPGNGASIGGIKVIAENGWFAARPSGTEDIYKIYAESFTSEEHLKKILSEAEKIVKGVFKVAVAMV